MQAFIAANINLVIQLANTFILFLLLKHFLFQPVKSMIDKREKEIKDAFEQADAAKTNAFALEQEYAQKIATAKSEAADIMREASKKAELQSDEIIARAKSEAVEVMEKAHTEIEWEKKKAMNDIKDDIADIASMIASKVIEKDVSAGDHERLIQNFIDGVGESSWNS